MTKEHEPTPAAHEQGTILVVDDTASVLELARELLQEVGFEVLAASGGREAVEIFRARPQEIDAVVLDLIMPDLDGEETLAEIRRIRSDVPVILVTGYQGEKTVEDFAARGVSSFLRKPYEPEALVGSVRASLAQHHA